MLADFSFENCPELDILLVPGGWGTRQEMFNETLLDFVRTRAPRVEILASVCTGALILASAGLLDGLPATWLATAYTDKTAGKAPGEAVFAAVTEQDAQVEVA